jgi:hypothetical protein
VLQERAKWKNKRAHKLATKTTSNKKKRKKRKRRRGLRVVTKRRNQWEGNAEENVDTSPFTFKSFLIKLD